MNYEAMILGAVVFHNTPAELEKAYGLTASRVDFDIKKNPGFELVIFHNRRKKKGYGVVFLVATKKWNPPPPRTQVFYVEVIPRFGSGGTVMIGKC